jgi:hypothetical protein
MWSPVGGMAAGERGAYLVGESDGHDPLLRQAGRRPDRTGEADGGPGRDRGDEWGHPGACGGGEMQVMAARLVAPRAWY